MEADLIIIPVKSLQNVGHLLYLGSFDLLFDERGVYARILQLFYDILGVFKGTQQCCHVSPELPGQIQDIIQLTLPLLSPLPDLIPQRPQA